MRPEVLWCGSCKRRGRDGWSFPPTVRATIVKQCEGLTVLHLFGGVANFGIRMDIDPSTRPHVVGDAWIPPFGKDSFDVVVMDPPYIGAFATLSNQKTRALFTAAAWVARRYVIWFSTIWVESPARMKLERSWLVRVGRHCWVRCLQVFAVSPDKLQPPNFWTRGPAIKYNRWLNGTALLPLDAGEPMDL